MKKFLGLLLSIVISLSFSVPSLAAGPIRITIDRQPISSDVAPQIINNRTMVPVRVISENLGYRVEWDAPTRRVQITKSGGSYINMWVGDDVAVTNGTERLMDSPPVIVGGRTLVPIRFIAEIMGMNVNWDSASRTVSITTVDNTPDAYNDIGQSGLAQIYGVDNSAFMGTWVSSGSGELTFLADGRCYFSSDAGDLWGTYKVDNSGMATAYFDMEELIILYYKVDYPTLYEIYQNDLLDTYTWAY